MPVKHAKTKKRTWVRNTALLVALVLIAISGGVAWYMHKTASQVEVIDVGSLVQEVEPSLPTPEPSVTPKDPTDKTAGQALNILVLGSDSREGDNQNIGGGVVEGMRSDTTLIAHVAADRSHVTLVSIPRDSWVQIPSCQLSNGKTTKPQTSKFNAAFALGGQNDDLGSAVACSITTVQSLTGLTIDGYAVIDMQGFANVVDALGGVEMNITERIDSPKAGGLVLEPGVQLLDGQTATQYARARSGAGLDGSDLSRISRQQELFQAILTKAKSEVSDPFTMSRFLYSVTPLVTVSPSLAPRESIGLFWSLRNATFDFITVPNVERGDGANVIWTDGANDLWQQLSTDSLISR